MTETEIQAGRLSHPRDHVYWLRLLADDIKRCLANRTSEVVNQQQNSIELTQALERFAALDINMVCFHAENRITELEMNREAAIKPFDADKVQYVIPLIWEDFRNYMPMLQCGLNLISTKHFYRIQVTDEISGILRSSSLSFIKLDHRIFHEPFNTAYMDCEDDEEKLVALIKRTYKVEG